MSASQVPTAGSPGRARARARADSRGATAAIRTREAPAPDLVLDRYRLHRRIGVGGFGTVWMARDERLERDVAVKIVPRERVHGGRFEREARAAARLAHPGIVTLYEAAVDDEGAYLVTELVRGQTLADLLEAGRLSDRDVVELIVVLCDALAHAHAQGVVHRDVKPSNILVPDRPSSPAQLAKLTDFGVARVIGGDSLTRTGDVIGTAAYMAPEQAEGLEATAAADLYSLALVAYEALTGVNPVRTGTAAQRARRLGAHLPPLRRQRRDLPRELGCAIDLALRPRPRERGTLSELRAALTQSLPELGDTPGVVRSPWPWHGEPPATDPELEPFIERRASSEEPESGQAASPGSWSQHALAALGVAALSGWLSAHVLFPSPIAPLAAALLLGVLAAAVPRIGFSLAIGYLALAAAAQGHAGVSALLGLAALPAIVLLIRSGPDWSLPAGAPALALIGLGGAWPALAARASTAWRRAVLGATGWLWIVLAAPLRGGSVYLHELPGAGAPHLWSGSLQQTASIVVRPILSSGVLAGAPVWALAAITLPWLVRGRSVAADTVRVVLWAVTVVLATGIALGIEHPAHGLLAERSAVVGGIGSVVLALASSFREWLRRGRARTRVP